MARILESSKTPACLCPAFLCLFAEHVMHIKEDKVPAWRFYQITEQERHIEIQMFPGLVPVA